MRISVDISVLNVFGGRRVNNEGVRRLRIILMVRKEKGFLGVVRNEVVSMSVKSGAILRKKFLSDLGEMFIYFIWAVTKWFEFL